MSTYLWCPVYFRLGGPNGWAWIRLPLGWYIGYNEVPGETEVETFRWGLFSIIRPMTPSEAAFLEANEYE